MKTYIKGIKVTDIEVTQKQILDLSDSFDTDDIDFATGTLQIVCSKKMKPYRARAIVADKLNCSFTKIRIKYYEK